ncbi:MAG: pantoate--beta-alanine ligase [Turneriella sp.]
MQIIRTRAAMREYARQHSDEIGFVPTMGYLHEGHLSLVRRARAENRKVVVSIFVNPAQFNDPKDLEKYPVDFERDAAMLEREGVDAVFAPTREEIYPNGVPSLRMSYDTIMNKLCGAHRPGHFEGVLLVVHNLFMWVQPRRAYFGLKDYQQYLLVSRMAHDLEFAVDVIGCPLVRESDGLAMSSRNVRLSAAGRQRALTISRALFAAAELWRGGAQVAETEAALHSALAALEVEYATICDAQTLVSLTGSEPRPDKVVIAVAAFVDGVRLIDNILI